MKDAPTTALRPLLEIFRDYLVHRREPILNAWLENFDWTLTERTVAPNSLHATYSLPDVVEHTGPDERELVETFVELHDKLQWLQSYSAEDFGQHFIDNYAHVELMGPRGHFASDTLAAGLALYGPNVDYPDHWHEAQEIYIPLTGTGWWSFDSREYVGRGPGEFIFHDSNVAHAIKTDDAPLLALWIWRGGDLSQKGNY